MDGALRGVGCASLLKLFALKPWKMVASILRILRLLRSLGVGVGVGRLDFLSKRRGKGIAVVCVGARGLAQALGLNVVVDKVPLLLLVGLTA